MKKLIVIVLALAVLSFLPVLRSLGEEKDLDKQKVSALMQKKLLHSQKILEGLALNDFDNIAKNADDLIDISKATEWRVLKTPRYEIYSADFQRTAERLIKAAKDKNLEAAALSYVELTLNCVKCHQHVREVRMVRLDD